MLKGKRTIPLIVLVVLGTCCAVGLVRYKYYVKKFIKSNNVLYASAKKAASMKHSVVGLFSNEAVSEPDLVTHNHQVKSWSLTFDAAQSLGTYNRFWGNLGYESFKNGILNGQNRQLFAMMAQSNALNSGSFRYIRAHNLFSDGRAPWGEGSVRVTLDDSGNVTCDWELADRVFDTILANGFRPIVELGFMPDALASLPDRRQKWGRANISPPKDYLQWQDLVFQTVRHLRERYGEQEINEWYFEVWNEPDLGHLFWVEDPEQKNRGNLPEYLKLYDYAVHGAKNACPSIRIGGPASAGGYIDGLVEHVVLEKSHAGQISAPRLDFISSHAYGYITEENRRGMNIFKAVQWKLDRALNHDHPDVRQRAQGLPFLLTETGFGAKKGEFNNDRFMAAWLAKFVTMNFHLRDKVGRHYQPSEFVLWSDLQIARDFSQQRGVAANLKTPKGRKVFKRPIYNAFEALGFLSDERIDLTTGARFGDPVYGLATKRGDRSVEILIYHLNERDAESVSADTFDVSVTVQNLNFRKYDVQHYLVDETHSNAYTAWQAMGRPRKLSAQQADRLSEADDLMLLKEPWTEVTSDGMFNHDLRLQSNSLALLVLRNKES